MVSARDPDIVLVAGETGIYRSTDAGTTLEHVFIGSITEYFRRLFVDPADEHLLARRLSEQ